MSAENHIFEIADQQDLPVSTSVLSEVVQAILTDYGYYASEISLALVDDPTIRELNKRYLQHDYETDVISFVLEQDEASKRLVGQLIVSTETANRVASEVGGTFPEELALYVIHGTLHLMGLDDHDPADASLMREKEKEYLRRAGLEHRGFDSTTRRQAN